MVKGVLYYTSQTHKLNIKSSTETELLDTDDVVPQLLWKIYFLEYQGYRIEASKLYRYNMSAMLLEKNWKT